MKGTGAYPDEIGLRWLRAWDLKQNIDNHALLPHVGERQSGIADTQENLFYRRVLSQWAMGDWDVQPNAHELPFPNVNDTQKITPARCGR